MDAKAAAAEDKSKPSGVSSLHAELFAAAAKKSSAISKNKLYQEKVSWDVNNKSYKCDCGAMSWNPCSSSCLLSRERFELPFFYECDDGKTRLEIAQNNKSKAGAVWSAGIQVGALSNTCCD